MEVVRALDKELQAAGVSTSSKGSVQIRKIGVCQI